MTAETGFVPKYQKIINELHAMLRQGVLKPGDKLPSREELVERYGVTRATVNRAVGELLREGLLKASQRGGTFVSDAPEIEEKAAFIVHIELLMAHLAEWNSALNFYSMFGRLFQLVPEEKRQILNVTDVRRSPEILRSYRRILWNNLSREDFERAVQVVGDRSRFLLLNRYYPDCDFVSINHRQAAFDLADAFLANLPENTLVGLLDMPFVEERSNRFVWTERRTGFMDACEKHRRFFRLIEFKQHNEPYNREQLAEFDARRSGASPALLLSSSAEMTGAVLNFLKERSYRLNRDYFYGDFDNEESRQHSGIAIPTVVENFRHVAEVAYDYLWETGCRVFVPHQLRNLPFHEKKNNT